jgi:hypothetical protein
MLHGEENTGIFFSMPTECNDLGSKGDDVAIFVTFDVLATDRQILDTTQEL